LKYRAEIDGLRALAVVPVILFHAGFELFSGGFVGVDVFFVISGYLITTILIEDIENQRFSILNFYERRARRILPALFFVMLVCIPFAWMWMLPNQMKDFSQSLVAVSLFASNILFWRESGYFAAAAEEKPLLHTWSLAVEEQYYVLFPIFLILAWRFGKNRVFLMIMVMAAISLLLSEWGWRNEATANFYLAPTRAWELFAGSIVAFIVQKKGVQKNNPLAAIGLAAIVFSIFFYDETTPFPSVYALVPVLGVGLLVLYADKETFAAKLLSTKIFVGIGLISYSGYLWHQPLFAFARIRSFEHPSTVLMLALSFISVLLGYFSWRYIEKPFRSGTMKTCYLLTTLLTVWVVLFLIGILSFSPQKKFSPEQKEYLSWLGFSYTAMFEKEWEVGTCYIENGTSLWRDFDFKGCISVLDDGVNIVLLGDSHAAQLASSIRNIEDINLTNLSSSGCRPLLNSSFGIGINPECINRNKFFFNTFLKENKSEIDLVILAAHWQRNELRELSNTLNNLNNLGVKVLLIGGSPIFSKAVPELAVQYTDGTVGRSVLSFSTVANDLELTEIMPDNMDFVSVEDFICPENCFLRRGTDILLFDTEHFTPIGASYFVDEVLYEKLSKMVNGENFYK